MTQEEIQEFNDTIKKTIMPYAQNMNEKQIKDIIDMVERDNPTLPKGFGDMLFKQIMEIKYSS